MEGNLEEKSSIKAVLAFVLLQMTLIVSIYLFPRCRLVPIQGGLLPQGSNLIPTADGQVVEKGGRVTYPGLPSKVFSCPNTPSALSFARAKGLEVKSVHTDSSGPGDIASSP